MTGDRPGGPLTPRSSLRRIHTYTVTPGRGRRHTGTTRPEAPLGAGFTPIQSWPELPEAPLGADVTEVTPTP